MTTEPGFVGIKFCPEWQVIVRSDMSTLFNEILQQPKIISAIICCIQKKTKKIGNCYMHAGIVIINSSPKIHH
ncbi:hypothetical protein X798_03569 [Onchocerca flexuosa]|uniref:Uncharacterized protein n=1 Tax=Onchocerca flexuosa TaxID=387005 RepID=A0A238BXQ0_9BILA|nr:hypothetical protein X798_03569 [Onchocerca flexuosa]